MSTRKTARLNPGSGKENVKRRKRKRFSTSKMSSRCSEQERLLLRKSLNTTFTFKKRKIKEIIM